MAGGRWQMTGKRGEVKDDSFLKLFIVLVLLTAHTEIFSVSDKKDV